MSKFLKFFDNNEQRSAYELSEQYVSPYVSAIKGANGGGVEPHYNLSSNVPPNALCILTLKDNSTVYITGEDVLNNDDMQPYKENVVSAVITNRCRDISDMVFQECNQLSSVIMPDSVTSLGEGCFFSCSSLSSVTLSNNITSLQRNTFMMCTSLEHISLPNRLNRIGDYSFYSCGLKELIIPEGVTEIGGAAVTTCPNLETITFPSSLERVDTYEYLTQCEKLRYIKIIGTRDIFDILRLFEIRETSKLTVYVDSSLVETYKQHRDDYGNDYNILPLEQ